MLMSQKHSKRIRAASLTLFPTDTCIAFIRQLLLVAFLGQGRRQDLAEHDDINRVGHPYVGVGHVEPVLDRTDVRAGEDM